MELPDGRLPESFGQQAFPEPKPFEIGSPAKPVEPSEMPAAPPVPPTTPVEPATRSTPAPSAPGSSARSSDEAKPGTPKTGAQKTGAQKAGGQKAGGQKAGGQKAGGQKGGGAKGGGPKAPGGSSRGRGPAGPSGSRANQGGGRPANVATGSAAGRPPQPPAIGILPVPPKPSGSNARSALVVLAVVAVVVVIGCCAFSRTFGGDDAADVSPAVAETTGPARVAEAAESPVVEGPCPAIGFLGADELGPDAVDARRAVQLAVSRYNTESRCSVRLVEADTGHSGRQEASAAFAKFGDDVIGVVGPIRDADIALLGPGFDGRRLPYVTPWSGAAVPGLKMFHRLYPSDLDVADAAGKLLRGQLKARKLFVIRHGGDAEKRVADRLARSADVSIVDTVPAEATAMDYRALAGRVRGSGAEAVFFRGSASEVAFLAQALRAAGFAGPVLGGEAMFEADYARLAAAAGTNTFALCGCAGAADESFAAEFRRTFGAAPGRHAAAAYDAAVLLLGAITNRAATRADLQTALTGGPFKLTQGTYRFTATGDLDRSSVVVNVYRPDTTAPDKPAMVPFTSVKLLS